MEIKQFTNSFKSSTFLPRKNYVPGDGAQERQRFLFAGIYIQKSL